MNKIIQKIEQYIDLQLNNIKIEDVDVDMLCYEITQISEELVKATHGKIQALQKQFDKMLLSKGFSNDTIIKINDLTYDYMKERGYYG